MSGTIVYPRCACMGYRLDKGRKWAEKLQCRILSQGGVLSSEVHPLFRSGGSFEP